MHFLCSMKYRQQLSPFNLLSCLGGGRKYIIEVIHGILKSGICKHQYFSAFDCLHWMKTDLFWFEVMELMLRKAGDYFLNSYTSKDGMYRFF